MVGAVLGTTAALGLCEDIAAPLLGAVRGIGKAMGVIPVTLKLITTPPPRQSLFPAVDESIGRDAEGRALSTAETPFPPS